MNIITPTTNLDTLWYWMAERERIRVKKEAGAPFPWTDDPIISEYRFTNVRREDDKVTIWIRENIREPYADNPNLWFMLCVARIINLPESLQELMDNGAWPVDEWEPEKATAILEARRERGDQVETGAYMIRAENHKTKSWFTWTKQRYICEIVLGRTWNQRKQFHALFPGAGLHRVHGWLKTNYGWADFMSYQAVVDMRFTAILENAFDRDRWAAAGPGTARGLHRIHGRPVVPRIDQQRALAEMRVIYEGAKQIVPSIDFSDIPNILCETDKYLRVRNSEGKPRAKYRPAA